MLGLLSRCSDKRPIELSSLMTLSRAEFSSCFYSASFEVILAQYTYIPGAPGDKSK
jgi:hypothetical protein